MPWLPKDKVVVPVDFSDASVATVQQALLLVADPSHLYVVHVLPILTDYEGGIIWSHVDDESRRHHALLALQEKFGAAKYPGVNFEVTFGDPGHEIADYAERLGAGLIVLPSHGRTGITRLLIGSVAERVVRLAHCPVLVLKQTAASK